MAGQRGDSVTVVLNLSDRRAVVPGVEGTVLLGTDRWRYRTVVCGLEVRGWEAAVIRG